MYDGLPAVCCIPCGICHREEDIRAGSLFFSLQVRRGQRTVQTEAKYIELMVVNDHEMVNVKPKVLSFFASCCMKETIN